MDMRVKSVPQPTFSTRRIEALTDGVFAIAMTLMVLELKLDNFSNITSSADLWGALTGEFEGILVFIISFLLLGSMWAIHTRQFEYIAKTDRHLTMINTLRLLVVVCMPLAASIAGAYEHIVLAEIVLPINFFLLALISYWQWRYATTSPRQLASKTLTHDILSRADIRNKAVLVVAFIAVLLALAIGELAFLLFIFLGFFESMVQRLSKKQITSSGIDK